MERQMDAPRKLLEEERDQLQARLAELTGDGFDPNFADHGQVAAEQGEVYALAGVLRDQLSQVDAALARIEAGTYGTCEVCAEPIGPARLEALPSTTRCLRHA